MFTLSQNTVRERVHDLAKAIAYDDLNDYIVDVLRTEINHPHCCTLNNEPVTSSQHRAGVGALLPGKIKSTQVIRRSISILN